MPFLFRIREFQTDHRFDRIACNCKNNGVVGAIGAATTKPKWRNWQTRMVQVHVTARSWGFESLLRHQSFLRPVINRLQGVSICSTVPKTNLVLGFFFCHRLCLSNARMAMGRRVKRGNKNPCLRTQLPRTVAHPFYEQVKRLLENSDWMLAQDLRKSLQETRSTQAGCIPVLGDRFMRRAHSGHSDRTEFLHWENSQFRPCQPLITLVLLS